MSRKPNGVGSWRGGGGPSRWRPRYLWKSDTDPGRGGLSRLGLLVAALLCVATFVYLLFYLTRPPRPCFVAVGADPAADALRLDAPLDLLGWRSAERFLEGAARWTRGGAGHVVPGPVRLTADRAELREWVQGFRTYDPVVMYLGVPCSTSDWYGPTPEADGPGPVEPVLHVGGGKRLPVRWLLEEVTAALPDRRVVILLDPGRLRPDPAVGHPRDDFTERVKLVFRDLQNGGGSRLVVVCGADAGQPGWESEELGATAFAHAVIRTFDEPDGRTDVRTAGELFTEAADRLRVWSANNRPTVQTPVLLPSGDDGVARAAAIRLVVRPTDAAPAWNPVPLPPPEARAEWRERWETRTRLAARVPHPAAYAPRLWRRYQELLLRHEAAVRVGASAVAGRLAAAVRVAEADLAHPLGLVFHPIAPGSGDARPPSFGQALAFQAVSGPDSPDPPDPIGPLWDLANDPSDAVPTAAGSPDGRPSERHLAAMVQRFYRSVVSPAEPPPAVWKEALAVRVRADRAALGLPPPGERLIRAPGWSGPAAAASERLWPVVRETLIAADALRRRAEDRLFGPAPPEVDFAFARQFGAATDRAADVRFAFHVRDAVFADLPFLGRWAVAAGFGDEGVALWDRAHRLDGQLQTVAEQDPSALAKDAGVVWSGFAALRGRFDAAVREQTGAALQKTRPPKEDLLATPLLRPEDRERLLTAARAIAFDLLTKPSGPARGSGPGAPEGAPLTPVRVRLARAEVGLPPTEDDPSVVAARVAAKYRERSPLGSDEQLSRQAVPFQPDEEPWREPAAANARRQWGELLGALATRAVIDHWYDENPGRGGAPYYARVARHYSEDAAKLLDQPPAKALPADPLGVTANAADGPLRWTSELRRDLVFALSVPDRVPPGEAVLFRTLSGSAVVRYDRNVSGPDRALLPVRPGRGDIPFALVTATEDETPSAATATAGVYFRGQRPLAERSIAITRRPELVLTDPGPRSADAAIAVRADPAQPLRPVAVLLDYSGSMKEGLNGFKLPGAEDAWKEGPSKFNVALKRLELALAELPKGTPLRVRLFSAKGVATEDAVVYPKAGEPAVADWRGADDAGLKDLMARLRRYEPSGATPLIRSIITAARADLPERSDGPRTLVVLTDGADDSGQPGVAKEVRDRLRGELKNVLTATGVKLVVVQLALNEADRAISKELFADLPNLDVPGEVVSVEDAEGLRRELIGALWPKLVLSGGPPAGPNRYPPGGWPARPPAPPRGATDLEGDLDPNTLLWSPLVAPGGYSARVAGYPARGFPKVALAPGDFLQLSLSRTDDGFALRREVQADAFGRGLKAFRGDGAWVLSVVPPGVEDAREEPTFGAVALVEKVPPHRRKGADGATEDPLRHIIPEALWWHVSPVGDDPPAQVPVGRANRKTVVRRLYGYPAPAWDLRVEGWPRTPGGPGFEPATVRVWVPVIDPTPAVLPRVQLPRPGAEGLVSFGGRSFRVTVEPQRFADTTEPVECLVVRTEYPPGEPVVLRLAGVAPGVRTEHRYFRNANGYTAVFGPGAVPSGATDVQLQLVQVREFAAGAEAMIKLTPPTPALGRRSDGYAPVPSKVAP